MEIKIPKIVRALPLSEYAHEYGDAVMQVWVNPPKARTDEMRELLGWFDTALAEARKCKDKERREVLKNELNGLGERIGEWLAEIWSQGSDPLTRMSIEDVRALAETTQENDPGLYKYLVGRTWSMILDHRMGIKKN
jgi:hypothetical protein